MMKQSMLTDDLDFELPPDLIAQAPAPDRSGARLLHYRRADGAIAHRHITDLPAILRAGDLLVFNDSRVLPARFALRKASGGLVEGLFLTEIAPGQWRVLLRNLGNPTDRPMRFEGIEVTAHITASFGAGEHELAVDAGMSAHDLLEIIGRMPLPPYIKRSRFADPRDEVDRQRYQTVYAVKAGSVAAPTAGLHFDEQLLTQLIAAGIERTFVTLDVGMGTFKTVSAGDLKDHDMHAERYSISPTAAEAINHARAAGRRIIAVGTTACRVLESQPEGTIKPHAGETRVFIYPPYRWKHVDGLLTNFHLPRSTLIALVAAMVGLQTQRSLYAVAIDERYRFFSYGDAMLLE